MLHMRPSQDEHHGTKACNHADSCPTLRNGIPGIYLTAPLDAQAGAEGQTRLSWNGVIESLLQLCVLMTIYTITRYRPTVCFDVISLVASSCGYYRGHIEPRVAQ